MNVHERFSAVQAAMSKVGVDKSGRNKQQGYAYRGIDQVMNALAPILAEFQLMIVPSVQSSTYVEVKTKNGGTMYHHIAQLEYIVYGPEGDSMGPFGARGECLDSSDKGLNKACIAAYKYWVLTALCVPLEGQDDADSVTPEVEMELITREQRLSLHNIAVALSEENNDKFWVWMRGKGVEQLEDIPAEAHDSVKAALEGIYAKQYEQEQAETAKAVGDA
jgi:hypothetical protein